jgi:hypothetical protein
MYEPHIKGNWVLCPDCAQFDVPLCASCCKVVATAASAWSKEPIQLPLGKDGKAFDLNNDAEVFAALEDASLSTEVAEAVRKILTQRATISKQRHHIDQHGSVDGEVRKGAASQAVDAIGVLALMCAQYERQLADIDGTEFYADFVKADSKAPLENALASRQVQLCSAMDIVVKSWNVDPASFASTSPPTAIEEEGGEEGMAALPIAVPSDAAGKARITMQTVLGKLALEAGVGEQEYRVRCVEAKVRGRYTMGPNPHAGKSKTVTRMGLAATEALKHNPKLEIYDTKRAAVTSAVIQQVFCDMDRFDAAYLRATQAEGATTALAALAACSTAPAKVLVAPNGVALPATLANAATLLHDPALAAHASTSLEYAVVARWNAAITSIALFFTVSVAVRGAAGDGTTITVIPGPVKGLDRMVFKSGLSYKFDFSLCTVLDCAGMLVVRKIAIVSYMHSIYCYVTVPKP